MRAAWSVRAVTVILASTALAVSPRAFAADPPTIVTAAELDRVLARDVEDEGRSLGTVLDLLGRAEVAALARDLGVDLRRAEAALSTLDRAELELLARQTHRARGDLAAGRSGGAHTRLLSGVLLLILVVLLVLIVAEPL
jgi:hypothetical protein